jgi:hypothetical protein
MSGCCDEPGCRRAHPVGVYLADLSGRVYAVTSRRVVRDNGDGTALFAAAARHDITIQMRRFITASPSWVRDVLGDAQPLPTLGSGAPAAGAYTTGDEQGDPRTWDEVRAAALDAVRQAAARKTSDIVDVVLQVLGEETVSRMTDQLVQDTRIRSMDFRNGAAMDLEPSRELIARWVGAARGMLGDAPNYCETEIELGRTDPDGFEMTAGLAGDPERFVFRLQRAGRLTPHQARIQAEQRADDAEQRLAEAEAELARLRAAHPATPEDHHPGFPDLAKAPVNP